jgi:broad-specificity NMP kinase
VEQLAGEAGFPLITGAPGTGKSATFAFWSSFSQANVMSRSAY